jgi:hypothetical protein
MIKQLTETWIPPPAQKNNYKIQIIMMHLNLENFVKSKEIWQIWKMNIIKVITKILKVMGTGHIKMKVPTTISLSNKKFRKLAKEEPNTAMKIAILKSPATSNQQRKQENKRNQRRRS